MLKSYFFKLLSNYTNDEYLINLLWKNIDHQYSENHRTYHNKKHLIALFNYYDYYKNYLNEPDSVAFSIFYHDIIYSIWKKDNEEKSADFAISELQKINLPSNLLNTIYLHIIATKTHNTINKDTKWLIDFDLGILGQSSKIYTNYTQLIRKEYKAIPNFIYNKGRKKVVMHFIDKPFIYSTDEFREKFEKKAKQNLLNELYTL